MLHDLKCETRERERRVECERTEIDAQIVTFQVEKVTFLPIIVGLSKSGMAQVDIVPQLVRHNSRISVVVLDIKRLPAVEIRVRGKSAFKAIQTVFNDDCNEVKHAG